MKPIKFRIWNKTKNKYIYSDEFDGEQTLNLYFFFKFIEDMKCCGDEFSDLEQFTGLLDKNGNEIYEGDIICGRPCFFDRNFNEVLSFTNTKKEIYWSGSGFYVQADQKYPIGIQLVDVYNREIIGNIHETPELLEKKKCLKNLSKEKIKEK